MLTNARGTHWRRIRSAVSPAFTKNRTRRLYPLLLQRARHFLRLIRSIQQDQQDQFIPAPTSTRGDSTASKTVGGTATDTVEPGLGGEDKVCAEMSKENVERGSKYPKKMTAAGDAEEAMEMTSESKDNVEQGSRHSKKRTTEDEATDSTVQTNELDMSTLQGKDQQTMAAGTTAPSTTARTTQHHTAHTRHKQRDTPTPAPNEELIFTSPATDTENTHVATATATRTQHRDKEHDTNNNNNSTRRSTTTRVDMEVQTNTQTHLDEINIAATTPRKRNTATATADNPETRNRGGEKPTKEELKRKNDIEVSPISSFILFYQTRYSDTRELSAR